ncbi:MAG: glycosyltransferase family 2 protein, partial [Bacteroidota bacterium]|nr:glycosyltransferase family 2 protein [Bacteroidota bacterium]
MVLCTYNRARLLPRALRSLIHQHWQDWEAIVVDDGSTDATPLLLAAARAEEQRLRFLRISHQGPGAARQYGIRHARGTYITFLDSDDEYLPEHLELRARYLQHNPEAVFLHGGFEVIGPPLVPDRHNPSRLIPISEC